MSRCILYELKELTANTITDTYSDFGSATLHPCIIYNFTNTSDVEYYVSFNGVDNDLRIPQGSTIVYDTTNVLDHADSSVYLLRANTQIQIKLQNALAPATYGDIYVNILTVTFN